MCNRFFQHGREVRPGQRAVVLMGGPGGEFEGPFDEAIFGGPARNESRNYWLQREGTEPVLVPDIARFGKRYKATKAQTWEDVPAGSAMEGFDSLCAPASGRAPLFCEVALFPRCTPVCILPRLQR